MSRDDRSEKRNWKVIAAALGIGLVLVGLFVFGALRMMRNSELAPPPKEQQIIVMPRAEPPPPPPPPPEQPPPPEEEKVEEPVPEEEPTPEPDAADDAPAGDDLGVDAEGSGSGDGFGLVGKKGGRGLIGGGDSNRWYAGIVQQDLQRRLMESDAARKAKYAVIIRLWFNPDGAVSRYELAGSTGDAESEQALRAVLAKLRLDRPPPENMPQPMKLRIVSR
ncbi:MAG: TonB-dependent receptor [Gammaproteobacteria bacterium]|nr:TonB-dependent receptor [Gammaproteobacteria bacterium]